MRLYMYGVIPPSNSLTFEEGINGGVAFRALHGEPQIAFAVTRYASAIGFLLVGYNALGLRIVFIVAGILSIPILYLLLRELVSASIALFGTLLFAAAYWPSFLDRHAFEVGTMLTLLMAYLLVKGIKTRSSLAFFGFGILCSLISYEYENFKPAPFYAVGFLALLGLWQLLPAVRRGLRPLWDACLGISRKAWRPALAFALAAGITAGPLMVGAHLGKDVYLSSLHRQEADRKTVERQAFRAELDPAGEVGASLFLPAGPTRRGTACPSAFPESASSTRYRRLFWSRASYTPASCSFVHTGYSFSAGSWRPLRAARCCYRTGSPGSSWDSCRWASYSRLFSCRTSNLSGAGWCGIDTRKPSSTSPCSAPPSTCAPGTA